MVSNRFELALNEEQRPQVYWKETKMEGSDREFGVVS
jgi:hypothetical protein